MTGFTIGADPELFLRENGKPISAFGMVEGTKESPFKTDNGAYQVDGMALEFNIDPVPTGNSFERFNVNIIKTIQQMKDRVAKNAETTGKRYAFAIQPTQDFDESYLAEQPKEALELGCDPDFNAYTGEENPRPDGTRNFRTAAGHIHVGWSADIPTDNEEHREICNGFVKMLDATVGLFMTYIDRDPRRREMYGKAGACRYKPYGVEYRTPSNVWIINRERREMIYYLVTIAINYMRQGYSVEKIFARTEEDIQEIINTGNYVQAEVLLSNYVLRYNHLWTKIKADPRLAVKAD
jgi:Phage phiEco32-like COOH.NH2 ligase-type 2